MPEPSSSAAAGNAKDDPIGSPPLSGSGVGLGLGLGVCAKATGARTSISTSTSVAKKIALFIQSSFFFSIFQTAYKTSPSEKSTHSVQNPNAKVSIILTIFNRFNIGMVMV